jgi:hypothetical protein
MGIAVSTDVSTVVNTQKATTFQQAQNTCTASCNQIQQGTTIILSNTTTGNITFDQQCTANANCYMTNAVDQAVTQFQEAQASGTASPALFPGIQINTSVSTTVNDLQNDFTQILNNICSADINQVNYGTMIYATNSKTGDISFTQNGNATADCVMENSARIQLQMQQKGTATAAAGSTIAGLASAIIAAVIIVVIIVAVISIVRGTMSQKQEAQKQLQQGRTSQPQQAPARRSR